MKEVWNAIYMYLMQHGKPHLQVGRGLVNKDLDITGTNWKYM